MFCLFLHSVLNKSISIYFSIYNIICQNYKILLKQKYNYPLGTFFYYHINVIRDYLIMFYYFLDIIIFSPSTIDYHTHHIYHLFQYESYNNYLSYIYKNRLIWIQIKNNHQYSLTLPIFHPLYHLIHSIYLFFPKVNMVYDHL